MTTDITREYISEKLKQLNSTSIFRLAHCCARKYKQLGGFGSYRDIFVSDLRSLYVEAHKIKARLDEAE